MNLNLKYLIPTFVLVVILLAGGGYLYFQSTKASKVSPVPTAQDDNKKLVMEVGKLMELPSEDPTVATVTDISRLKDQTFFQKAKNGDKVLIYTQAKKAILYDPNLKKIIDVAPLNIGSPSAKVATSSASPKPILKH